MLRRPKERPGTEEVARARLGLGRSRSSRRSVLTRRGRVTILIGIALAAVGVSFAFPIGAPVLGWLSVSSVAEVTAAQAAPHEVLARIPYTKGALEMASTAGGIPAPTAGAKLASLPVDPVASPRLVDWVDAPEGYHGPLRVEYSLDAELTAKVFKALSRGRVKRGHVIVLDVRSGRVMAYASADPDALPPLASYPAASLAKVVTVAASLEQNRQRARRPCLYRGDPYRLTKSRVHPARGGREASLERALARSYNQCFAQLAVHVLGEQRTVSAFERFGWGASPAAGHQAGKIVRGEGDYGLGKLGSGLADSRITALHAAQLVGALRTGEMVDPWWIDRIVDADGRSLLLPPRGGRRRVMEQATADEVRSMLVRTTTNGTARGAFRTRRGPRLGDVRVAGKTGNLSGSHPRARYEWFAGVAPAGDPRVAVAVVQAHGHLWWKMSAQIAADVFSSLFCEGSRCSEDHVLRYTGDLGADVAPLMLGE